MVVSGRRTDSFDPRAETDSDHTLIWVALPLLALVIITAVLYFARDIMIPLTAAGVLSLVLSPMVDRLERIIGRVPSVAMVVIAGVGMIATIGYFATVQLATVADEVAGYSDNIGDKVSALQKSTPDWILHIESAVSDVERRVQKPAPHVAKPHNVPEVAITSGSMYDNIWRVAPALAAFIQILLVIVLLFFLLYSRHDMRDRFVRLAARVRVTVASQAIETASHTVSRYLFMMTIINLAFGMTIGIILWFLDVPNAGFWGVLAFLLRYIPYVGTLVSSTLPTLVAFAVSPGWSKPIEVFCSFIALDLCTSQLVEPFLIGHQIDMSPVALLISTIYWSWLWGIPGLLLAIPLTVCLKVAGEHIPALNFLSLVLGGERELESYHDFYRMLLERDTDKATTLAVRYCDENGLEEIFDDIIAPVLKLAGDERAEGHISDESAQFIFEFVRELVPGLGSRFSGPRGSFRPRVLGICPAGEMHTLAMLMVLESFRYAGAVVKFVGEDRGVAEVVDTVRIFDPDIVCLSCTLTERLPDTAELATTLKNTFPHLLILAGGVAALSYPADLMRAGCTQVSGTRSQALRAIRQLTNSKINRKLVAHEASAAN